MTLLCTDNVEDDMHIFQYIDFFYILVRYFRGCFFVYTSAHAAQVHFENVNSGTTITLGIRSRIHLHSPSPPSYTINILTMPMSGSSRRPLIFRCNHILVYCMLWSRCECKVSWGNCLSSCWCFLHLSLKVVSVPADVIGASSTSSTGV